MRISDGSSDVCSSDLPIRRVDDVRLDHQVVVEELGGAGVVGVDPADPRGGEEDIFRAFGAEEAVDRQAVRQVRLGMATLDDAFLTARPQRPRYGGADQSAMAGDEDPRLGIELHHRLRATLLDALRSEEHTSELQSLMRTSYAVF